MISSRTSACVAFLSLISLAALVPGATGAVPPSLIRSTALEVIELTSMNRRVVYRAPGKMEAPHFSPDGTALYFNRDGRIERVKLLGREPPTLVDTGFAKRCINDHGISPDGTQLVISDLSESGKSRIAVATVPKHGLGAAINDRLRRAAAPR